MSETITLAQPPYAEKETNINRLTRYLYIYKGDQSHAQETGGYKRHSKLQPFTDNLRITEACVYLGAQAYSTLEQLTEPGNQLSQHRNIEVLQTLSTGTHKTDPYKTDLIGFCHVLSSRNLTFFPVTPRNLVYNPKGQGNN